MWLAKNRLGYPVPCSTPEYPQFTALYRATELAAAGHWEGKRLVSRGRREGTASRGIFLRQELRAGTDCRPAWQPLIELQYRGRVWHQPNGRDWSIEAFLVSDNGLRLDVSQDAKTHEAMRRALPLLAEASVEALRTHRLDSDDFDKLAVSDPVRDLLRWMSNPDLFRRSLDAGRWQSFCNVCKSEFNVDPDDDGPSTAANHLVTGGG